jgi:hypothetical protein
MKTKASMKKLYINMRGKKEKSNKAILVKIKKIGNDIKMCNNTIANGSGMCKAGLATDNASKASTKDQPRIQLCIVL